MFDNDLIPEETGWVPDIDERTEVELRSAMTALAHAIGPEQFRKLAMDTILALEPMLRATAKPGNPALEMLDQYYAAKLREERGFE